MHIRENMAYSSRKSANLLDLCLTDDPGRAPLLVFFYGGGLESGTRKDNRPMAEWFAGKGVSVALPDYRLYPEYAYPDFIEDAAESVAFCLRGVPHGSLFVGGHSAGAYLALMLQMDKRYLGRYGIDPDALAGYLPVSAQPTKHFNVLKYGGQDPRRVIVDDTSPLYHVDRPTLAPTLLICAEKDIHGRVSQNELLLSAMHHFENRDAALLVMPGAEHAGLLSPFEGEKSPAALPMLGFVRAHA